MRLFLAILLTIPALAAHAETKSAAQLGLRPASIQLSGKPGQSASVPFRVTNKSADTLTIKAEVFDLIVGANNEQQWVRAGELPGSIAGATTLAPHEARLQPGSTLEFTATFSVPSRTDVRAVMVRFSPVYPTGEMKMGVALASFVTFTLSEAVELETETPIVHSASASNPLRFEQPLANVGPEPFHVEGALVILDRAGELVGRINAPKGVVLPGRRTRLLFDFPDDLPSGDYRALVTLVRGAGILESQAEFQVQ